MIYQIAPMINGTLHIDNCKMLQSTNDEDALKESENPINYFFENFLKDRPEHFDRRILYIFK